MYTQMGGWCLTTGGAKVLVYAVVVQGRTSLTQAPACQNAVHSPKRALHQERFEESQNDLDAGMNLQQACQYYNQ